jgi:drug/metabolite transporter (DMT)-like permease
MARNIGIGGGLSNPETPERGIRTDMAGPEGSSNQFKGVAITALGVLILSPDGLLTSLVSADPRTQLVWRGLFMGLALTAFVMIRYRSRTGDALRLLATRAYLGVAVLFTVSSVGWVTAITSTSVANTLFIVACAPLFAAIFSWMFLRERVPLRTAAAILLAIAGMAVIFAEGLGRGDLFGNVAAVITALAWGAMVVTLRAGRVEDPAPSLALGGYLIALVGLAVAPTLAIEALDQLWLVLLGFAVLPLSFFLIGLGPRYIPAAEVSLIILLEAVLGPFWVWLAIGQVPSQTTLAGGAVILVTLAVHFAIGLRTERRGPCS